jgi:hypothetical protein
MPPQARTACSLKKRESVTAVALHPALWQLTPSIFQKAFAMRSILLFSAASLALATLSAPAVAQDVPSDLRCVLVGNAFAAAEKDEQKKQFATQVAHFFYGRVDARVTPAQLKVQVMAVARGLNQQMMAPTMNACVARLKAKLEVMQGIGREMAAAAGVKQPAAGAPQK